MQLIRCTKKLQKEMGLTKTLLTDDEPTFSYLGPWHANLIYIDRRKCILLVNDKTLLNFIIPDVSRAQIKHLPELFRSLLVCVLAEENIPESVRHKILAEYTDIGFTNTNSKSVLGSMNDLAFHYEHHILSEGGIHSHAIPGIISKLNHMPMGAIEYAYSIDALKKLYL